jgi:hypothetical protein
MIAALEPGTTGPSLGARLALGSLSGWHRRGRAGRSRVCCGAASRANVCCTTMGSQKFAKTKCPRRNCTLAFIKCIAPAILGVTSAKINLCRWSCSTQENNPNIKSNLREKLASMTSHHEKPYPCENSISIL